MNASTCHHRIRCGRLLLLLLRASPHIAHAIRHTRPRTRLKPDADCGLPSRRWLLSGCPHRATCTALDRPHSRLRCLPVVPGPSIAPRKANGQPPEISPLPAPMPCASRLASGPPPLRSTLLVMHSVWPRWVSLAKPATEGSRRYTVRLLGSSRSPTPHPFLRYR